MRSRKDRRKPQSTAAFPIEDTPTALERRKRRDRRMENMNAEERQLLLSEMPGLSTSKLPRKN